MKYANGRRKMEHMISQKKKHNNKNNKRLNKHIGPRINSKALRTSLFTYFSFFKKTSSWDRGPGGTRETGTRDMGQGPGTGTRDKGQGQGTRGKGPGTRS